MIFIGVGSNIPAKGFSSPKATIDAAVELFADFGVNVIETSKWYKTSPVPLSDQPWFVNGVLRVETTLEPVDCLLRLHRIEAIFERTRSARNESRTLDLDLLDYDGFVTDLENRLILPHPRLTERAFVLLPLSDVCPDWVSPKDGVKIKKLISKLPPNQIIKLLN
jgi:2-amino-4-hydroxy-6-hydroxymethyldihydropteridine diphosphokinase